MTTTHTQPAGCDLDSLRQVICGISIVGQIDGHDVIRRESVIDLIDRDRAAAARAAQAPQGAGRAQQIKTWQARFAEIGGPSKDAAIAAEIAELRAALTAAQAPQGDTRQSWREALELARYALKEASSLYSCGFNALHAQNSARGIDDTEHTKADYDAAADQIQAAIAKARDAVRVALDANPAAHTCTPADERALFDRALALSFPDMPERKDALAENAKVIAFAMFQAGIGAAQRATAFNIEYGRIVQADEKALRAVDALDGLGFTYNAEIGWQALAAQGAGTAPVVGHELTVWEGAMPESNGKSNFTAVLHRKDSEGFDRFTDGFQFARSEYPDRVKYEADFMRWLIGERESKPEVWDDCYDMDKHSGYTPPAPVSTAAATTASASGSTLPCPFCGSTDEVYVGKATYCDNCGADGPSYERDGKPVAAWNDRAPSRAADGQQGASRAVLDKPIAYAIFGINARGQHYLRDVKVIPADDMAEEWKSDDDGLGEFWAGNEALARNLPAQGALQPKLMRQAVASVVSRSGNDLRIGWLRPERCDVGTLLYCTTEPLPAQGAAQVEVEAARDEPASEKQEKLRALADRIDHDRLWQRPAMDRVMLTNEQRDRLDAGIMLRRYADLLAPGRWLVLPPTGVLQFSASTLDKAYEMAKRDQDRSLAAKRGGATDE